MICQDRRVAVSEPVQLAPCRDRGVSDPKDIMRTRLLSAAALAVTIGLLGAVPATAAPAPAAAPQAVIKTLVDPGIPPKCNGKVQTRTQTESASGLTTKIVTKYTNWVGFYSAGRGGYSFKYKNTTTMTTWAGSVVLTSDTFSGICYS